MRIKIVATATVKTPPANKFKYRNAIKPIRPASFAKDTAFSSKLVILITSNYLGTIPLDVLEIIQVIGDVQYFINKTNRHLKSLFFKQNTRGINKIFESFDRHFKLRLVFMSFYKIEIFKVGL